LKQNCDRLETRRAVVAWIIGSLIGWALVIALLMLLF